MKTPFVRAASVVAIGIAAGIICNRLKSRSRLRRGQVAIITGGSSGLGLALAHRFGKAGLRLVLAARNMTDLEDAKRELLAANSVSDLADIKLFACNLSDEAQAPELVNFTINAFGALDILVNNAGIIDVGPMENHPIEAYERAMAVNFFAALYATYAALPFFLDQRSGSIVNISSIGGKVAVPHLLPYVAAKFALTGFSEGMHAELRHKGIRVTTVCPGLMRTGGESHASFRGQVEKEKAWFQTSARTPLLAASVKRAAEQVFTAVNKGRSELTITPQAWLAARFVGLAPETTQFISSLINSFALPRPLGPVSSRNLQHAEPTEAYMSHLPAGKTGIW